MSFKGESALKKAIEMEKEGKQFYLKSAEKVKSLLARKIFEELAREEDYHIKMINKVYENLKTNNSLKDWITTTGASGDIEKVFKDSLVEKAKTSKNDINALRFALELEEKSTKYYEKLAGKAGNTFERRFYLALSYEERGHYLRIMDSIEYLSDPAGWHFVKQGAMVDGG